MKSHINPCPFGWYLIYCHANQLKDLFLPSQKLHIKCIKTPAHWLVALFLYYYWYIINGKWIFGFVNGGIAWSLL